jgi:GH24 family phage-related lysozyme (muramidase)
LKTSVEGIRLIKEFEGCVLTAYQDSVGVWTIGIGTTKGVKKGQVITEAQAIGFLEADLASFEAQINKLVKVQITQPMFDAIACFTYNLGGGALGSSTLLKKLNARDFKGAADEFLKWDKAGGRQLAGLTRRRQAERKLFLSGL